MRKISQRNIDIIDTDPFYKKCCRSDEGNCQGRITMDHTIIYAGKQLDEAWAIVPQCEYHHAVNRFQDGGDLNRERTLWIALNRATDSQLEIISKAIDYKAMRDRLNKVYV